MGHRPDTVRKTNACRRGEGKEGRIKDIRRCDRDGACYVKLFFGLPVRCKINPDMGRERYMPEYYQPPFEVDKPGQ
jgi:hypothetical protein